MRAFFLTSLLLVAATMPSGAASTLRESGSTLMYPLITTWAQAYSNNPENVQIETQSTGSGQGVADVISGTVQLGVTDAYAIDTTGAPGPLLQIPLAISAVQVNYNLPEAAGTHLRLTGELLAAIYSGAIRFWDDAAIRELNPTLPRALPHEEIITYHRRDSSGTTFVFTQFLSESSSAWRAGPGFANQIHWPAGSPGYGVVGNAGVFHACEAMRYSIGYMGVSYRNRTDAAGLGYAAIKNAAGAFVLPTPATIRAAAYALLPFTPDGARISLINAPGDTSYPIANYEYAIVREHQEDSQTADALTKFLLWTLARDGGSADSFLNWINFSALPANIREMAVVEIHRIR
jgi:phosphate transport system substrate-binding protein